MAVLRSVSEDDLTNVVQLSPLGKQDPLQGSFIQGCGFESALFLQAGSGSTLNKTNNL